MTRPMRPAAIASSNTRANRCCASSSRPWAICRRANVALRSYNFIHFDLTGIGLGIVGVGLFPTEGVRFSHELHMVRACLLKLI
jgi:hypothetical protein